MNFAVDGEAMRGDAPWTLSRPWDKYLVKRRDKSKSDSCAACLFEGRCSGVFEAYRRFHGTGELVPITMDRLRAIDPHRRFLALHLVPLLAAVARWQPPAPFARVTVTETGDAEATIVHTGEAPGDGLRLAVAHRPPGGGAGGFDVFSVHVLDAPADRALARLALRALWTELARGEHRVVHPLGDDAVPGPARTVAARLGRMREHAPFGALAWRDVLVTEGGRRAEASFEGPAGERATVWLSESNGRAAGGYRVDGGVGGVGGDLKGQRAPTAELVDGLRAIMSALGARAQEAVAARG